MDYKAVVREAYMGMVKGALNRALYLAIDDSIDDLLRLIIVEPAQVDELLITDKFSIYQGLWRAVVEVLYEEFLPHISYKCTWQLEVTPYTMLLCKLTEEHVSSNDLEYLQKLTSITDEQIESEFQSVVTMLNIAQLGLSNGLSDFLPAALLPSTRKEELRLLFRLMNFAPLTELALFQNQYIATLHTQFKKLSIGFSGIEDVSLPKIGMPEALRCSYFPIDQKLFKKYGLAGFEQESELAEFEADFIAIRQLATINKEQFKDDIISPFSGDNHTVQLPEEVLHYKYLIDNKKLSIAIGLLHFEEFQANFMHGLAEHLQQFLPEINRVDNPKCLILVEGESEELAIPILAFRQRFVLAQHGIQVFNSKSKEKLAADFMTFRAKYPNQKMICLLDSDAKKEKANLERVIKNNKHKYRLVFIEGGTFEDLFDLPYSVQTLNTLYPEGEEILVADFDLKKDFLANTKRLMFEKKKAEFDKVAFAKSIALQMSIALIPKEINEIMDIARDFTRETKYFRNK
jgi:hypothetical protein